MREVGFLEQEIIVPFLPKTTFTLKPKSCYRRRWFALARKVEFSPVPRFIDQAAAEPAMAWWRNHATEEQRRQLVEDTKEQLRQLYRQVSWKIGVRLDWAKNEAYCFVYDRYNTQTLLEDRLGEGWFEFGDGEFAWVSSWQRQRGLSPKELEYYRDCGVADLARKWYRFERVCDSVVYKTLPYLIGRRILRMYEQERERYGLDSHGKVRRRRIAA